MPACAAALRLLADETRLRLLHLLEREPLTVAELTTVLGLGQSSVSGHLAKLKQAGLIHDVAEGSAHRYRLREDAPEALRAAWRAARALAAEDAVVRADAEALARLRAGADDWVTRVAGSLHRAYAPGRTWEGIAHAVAAAARLGRCLDIGAGDGALAGLLAPACRLLVCLDPSPAMVAAGRARCAEGGWPSVRWVRGVGESLPFPDGGFDTVLLLQSLQYVAEPRRVLREAGRVLAPGGRAVVLTLAAHAHDEAARYGHRHRGFRERELAAWVRPWCRRPQCIALPPEPRPPRFQSLLLIAEKAPDHG